MTEYELAYELCISGAFGTSHWIKIRELVRRATPMKVNIRYATNNPTHALDKQFCPNCVEMLYETKPEYCPYCGQALDWV